MHDDPSDVHHWQLLYYYNIMDSVVGNIIFSALFGMRCSLFRDKELTSYELPIYHSDLLSNYFHIVINILSVFSDAFVKNTFMAGFFTLLLNRIKVMNLLVSIHKYSNKLSTYYLFYYILLIYTYLSNATPTF